MKEFALIVMTWPEKRLDPEEAHKEVNDFLTSLGINEDNRVVVTEQGKGINKAVHHHVFCALSDAVRITEAWDHGYKGAFRNTRMWPIDECEFDPVSRYLSRTCPERMDEILNMMLKMMPNIKIIGRSQDGRATFFQIGRDEEL